MTLVLATHPNYSKLKKVLDPFPPRKLEIGDDSWLGAGVIIMPNVKIGKMCVIGAGSVVTRDVPDFSVVVGSPARIIRTINNENN